MQDQRAPTYLVVARIGAVLGMSLAAAAAILLLIAGFFVQALIAFVIALPFIAVMRYIEVFASREHDE